jgi:hypothetical protein
MGQTVHVYPDRDLIEHNTDGDDDCGPTTEAVPDGEGGFGWLINHHSLDGRELREPVHQGPVPPEG